MWIFMLIMCLMVPLMMIGFGRLFMKSAPGKINPTFGYRTKRSMKNDDTWRFAHDTCGKLWYKIGLILLPASMIPFPFCIGKGQTAASAVGTVVIILQTVLLLLSIFPVEAALKKEFDENGQRRNKPQP